MDPICHTLVGGCLAQAGLKRRTRYGLVTLLVAANLPDVDILSTFLDRSLELRRGWTHGLPALVVWPILLGAVMWLWARWRHGPGAARFGALALLSAIGVATHPALDFLNTYGMRWLMPFRDVWYYGDTLFIVDPWLWLLLAGAIWLVRRRERRGGPDPGRPARVALATATLYIGAMMAGTLSARAAVARAVPEAARFMVAPVPVLPLERQVIVDEGDAYREGSIRIAPRSGPRFGPPIPKGDLAGLAPLLVRDRDAAAFLRWARFPVFRTRPEGDSLRVDVYDLRYSDGRSGRWASLSAAVPRPAPREATGR